MRDLAATAWAVASLDELPIDRVPVVELLSRKARPSDGMNGYDIAQVLWACCKLDVVPPFLPRYTVSSSAPSRIKNEITNVDP